MARVASCPQCEHELLVPEGADANAWATCPECRAFFELKDAKSRELPALLLVDTKVEISDSQSAATVADLASVATWTSDAKEKLESSAGDAELGAGAQRHAEGDQGFEPAESETPEAAALRIDQWFRSVKTVSDVPPLVSAAAAESEDRGIEPADVPGNSGTIDRGSEHAGFGGLNTDFELEAPPTLPRDAATWDDSQHMERLLAGLQSPPMEEFVGGDHEAIPTANETHDEPMGEWPPDVSVSILPGARKQRRKRSIARTLLFSAIGGMVGLGIGYYVLLWLRGPENDFLEIARYLPKAALPHSFQAGVKESRIGVPSKLARDEGKREKVSETVPRAAGASAEKQAAYTEAVGATKATIPADDRYAPAAKNAASPTSEPAVLHEPPATALTASTPSSAVVHIADAPSFTIGELMAALQAAKDARPGLVAGNLADGREVQHAKGSSYSIMADLAQKATFVEEPAHPAEAQNAIQQADELFRETLSNVHTREEVALITPKWIGSPNRRNSGVFFAGSVTRPDSKGTVVECRVELGGDQTLTVLLPASVARLANTSLQPVGIAGWIVDNPAEQVKGYTGKATQAVFANRLISLD